MKLYIRDYRLKANMNITNLSNESGAAKGYLSDLENGIKKNIGVDVLCKIAKALGVDVKNLFDCEGCVTDEGSNDGGGNERSPGDWQK